MCQCKGSCGSCRSGGHSAGPPAAQRRDCESVGTGSAVVGGTIGGLIGAAFGPVGMLIGAALGAGMGKDSAVDACKRGE